MLKRKLFLPVVTTVLLSFFVVSCSNGVDTPDSKLENSGTPTETSNPSPENSNPSPESSNPSPEADNPTPESFTASPVYNESLQEIYAKLGTVHKIYQSASAARFFTGQKIKDCFGCKEAEFTGVLVEYDSLDESIVKYVEKLPNNNAAVHQHYLNAEYDENEIYVEFSTYTNTENQEIICHEIRIFQGDFMKNFNGQCYAKSVTFDPTLTIDLDRMKNVKTGEPVEYTSDYTFYERVEACKSVKEYPEEFSKYGTVSEVYLAVNKYDEVLKNEQNDQQYYITYYVEYSSFNEVTTQYYNNRKADYSFFISNADFYIDSTMKYIKFHYVYDKATDKLQWGEAWISDPNDFPGLTYGASLCNCTYFFDEYPDLYSVMEYLASSEYKEVDSSVYPAVLSKFGSLDKVYAYVFEDGSVAKDYVCEGDYHNAFVAQYSSFNDTTKAIHKYAEDGGVMFNRDHSATYVQDKKYIGYWYRNNIYGDSIECNFYDPEVSDLISGFSDDGKVAKGEFEDFYAYCESLVTE